MDSHTHNPKEDTALFYHACHAPTAAYSHTSPESWSWTTTGLLSVSGQACYFKSVTETKSHFWGLAFFTQHKALGGVCVQLIAFIGKCPLCGWAQFISSFTFEKTLSCSQFGAITDKATMNVCVDISFHFSRVYDQECDCWATWRLCARLRKEPPCCLPGWLQVCSGLSLTLTCISLLSTEHLFVYLLPNSQPPR